ncbi:hypothetical protein SAMN05443144_101329 [Fodinibius roseus]|uniref:MetA-pathway of phenol degradation n=1 Tax=Fodinibius roseus TaxID=1194090 RepID=A0A1M4TM69_9BACT|nr:hypothetical protein [Fodinibius roseus]SHE45474.1 hypothetical protein SAMN05443144_101329 [Fodinibius roseus]
MKLIATYLLFLILCLSVTAEIHAQTFFEDAHGTTSINLPVGGLIRVNTTGNSLKMGYYYNRSDRDIVVGIDASGISNNGLAPLVTNKELSPEAHISFNLGLKNISTGNSMPRGYDYLNLRIGIGAAQYRMMNVNAPFEQQISTRSFNKVNIGLSYNYYLNGNMIFGTYAGYDRTNNISSLTELTIKETVTTGTDSNGTSRTAEAEYTAWEGTLRSVDQFSLFLDYVYIPDFLRNRVALSVYSRSRFNRINNITNGGLGLYLNREGAPLNIVGGLIYEFADLFDVRDTGAPPGERGTVGIVLGYHF